MKFIVLCVICGVLATSSFGIGVDAGIVLATESTSDESSDYSDFDLFGNAVKGLNEFLGNAIDEDEDDDDSSSESEESNENYDKADKIDNAIMNALLNEDDENDNDDDINTILYTVQSLFDGTVGKLARVGEGAVNEFFESLRDLIETFVESVKMEATISQAVNTEIQNTNSSNVVETSNGNVTAIASNSTTAEKDSNENNSTAIGQQENEEIANSAKQNNTQNVNDPNIKTENEIETDENSSEKENDSAQQDK